MNETTNPPSFATTTLKGKALIAAIEAGLVPKAESGEGYNIAGFLRFWEAFSGPLKEALDKEAYVVEMLDKQG